MPGPTQNYHSPWGESAYRPKSSADGKKPVAPKRWSGKFLFALPIFLVLLFLGVGFYYFYSSDGPRVSIEFVKPEEVAVGEPFVLGVFLSNLSNDILKGASVSVFLPDGVLALGQSQSQKVVERAVGDIGPGSVGREDFNLIVIGGGQELKRISAKLFYSTGQTSGTQFEKSSDVDIIAGESAASLSMVGPQNVFNEQEFELKVSYANNSNKEFKNMRLKLDYPPFFTFKRSSVNTEDAGNNSWFLGNVAPGSGGTITISGSVSAPQGSFFSFTGSLSAEFLGSVYQINSQIVNMSVSSSPLALDVKLNNSTDYIARLGENLTYTISYRNNSGIVMQDVVIKARLLGEMFDIPTLSSNGIFDSLTNTATWLGANTTQLLNVGPGQGGSISFNIRLKDAFPIRLISDKNYTIKIDARIESQSIPAGTGAEKTVSLASAENKISGIIDIDARAFWRDAASGILNQGPYPPKVNVPTQYTIHWIIKNFSTDVTDTALSAFLQSGARFTGQVKSNIETTPSFNPNSGLVTWNIGSIPATKGIVGQPIEAIFQIEVTPSITQVGDRIVLIGETKITATDAFTGLNLQDVARELDSSLPYDTTITGGGRGVQP